MPPSSVAVSQLRLDILWMSQRWLLGFGVVLRVFCAVLAHIAALCILVFMPLQRSDAFVEADESGADTWIQGFFAALFGGIFCPPRGGPLHHVCTPVWACMVLLLGYRPSLAFRRWLALPQQKKLLSKQNIKNINKKY